MMKDGRGVRVFGAFLALVLGAHTAFAAAEGAHTPEVKRLIAAAQAKAERELALSWGQSLGGYEGAKKFEALFNKMYGTNIKVNFTPGPSMTDMAGKISLEVATGRQATTDILLGTESHYSELLNRNVFEEYDYAKLSPRIKKEMLAPGNIGVEIYSIIVGITYNSDLISPAEVPRKLRDVLNPKWSGKIASTQNAGSFDRLAYRPEWGVEKMKEFVGRLSEHVGGLIRCNEDARVASGEFVMMVLNCNSAFARGLRVKGAPIGHVVPEDGATLSFGYMGIPRTSAHPNLSKLFIHMLLSEEGQNTIYQMTLQDHVGLAGSQQVAELKELRAKRVEPLRIDVKFVTDHPETRGLSDELRNILRKKK